LDAQIAQNILSTSGPTASILTPMRIRPCLLFSALVAISLTACHRAPDADTKTPDTSSAAPPVASGPPVKGDWVVQDIGADPDILNPIISSDATASMINGQIFEGLLQMDNQTLKLEPCLATSWEISPDQLTYTFHLRHDVTWQDGVPLTADDVKYTYDRVQDPKVDDAPMRSYWNTIKSCTVLDPYTVRFQASERYFKTLETLGVSSILPKHLLANVADFNDAPFNRAPIGTGPYKFVRWDTGSQIVLERNDHYWGTQNHYLNRLVYRVIQEPYVAVQLLKKGELDIVDPVAPLQWERELEHSDSLARLVKTVYNVPAYSFIGFNLRRPIFSDVRVRHAFDLLIPRDDILSTVYRGYGNKTAGYNLPASPSYDHNILPTPYDPAQASELLQQAGWKLDPNDGLLHKGRRPLSVTIVYPSASPYDAKLLELVQESMRRVGIDLKLERMEWVQMLSRLNDWDFDMTIMGWTLDVNDDPSQVWSGEQAKLKKSSNFIGYSNPEADKLMAEARLEYDDAKRAAIYRQLQKVIHDDYPVCFLFNPREIMLRSNRFQNVKIFAPLPCYDVSTWWVPTALQKYR
jgi:peptide/nickel transport system substrate-binding protein